MKKLCTLIVMMTMISSNLRAGWYKVYNFEGTIGKYPVQISIQIDELLEKESYSSVTGVYIYTKHGSPIKLYGTIFKNKFVQLSEYNERGDITASLNFELCDLTCTGKWKNQKIIILHL
jgi:hypothetical protein